MNTSEWIKAARAHANLTGEQLGEKLSVTKGNISHWELGKHEPSLTQLKKLADVTGFPLLKHELFAQEADAVGVLSARTMRRMLEAPLIARSGLESMLNTQMDLMGIPAGESRKQDREAA